MFSVWIPSVSIDIHTGSKGKEGLILAYLIYFQELNKEVNTFCSRIHFHMKDSLKSQNNAIIWG